MSDSTAPKPEALLVRDTEAAALCGLARSTWHKLRAADDSKRAGSAGGVRPVGSTRTRPPSVRSRARAKQPSESSARQTSRQPLAPVG